MRNQVFGMLSLCLVVFVPACGSEEEPAGTPEGYSCSSCAKAPEALAADDNLPSGIYKGVIIGDGVTGTIEAYIPADQTVESPSASLWINGKGSFINNGTQPALRPKFYSLPVTLVLNLQATGQVSSAELTFKDGTVAQAVVVKELSTQLVEIFEGTWTAGASDAGAALTGVWNYVVQGGRILGRYDGDDAGEVEGTATGTTITLTAPVGTGTRNTDEVAGTTTVSDTAIAWTGKRTL